VTDLQHEFVPETAPVEHHRSTLNRWLAGGLVVALLAAIGLGAWVFYDHNHTDLTSTQTAAVAVVNANLAAHNADDWTALTNTMTSDAVWMAVAAGKITDGPLGVEEYVGMIKSMGGVHFTTLGEPTVAGDTVVAVPVSLSAGATGTGMAVFTVRNDGGQVKVSEMVYLTEPSSRQ
jgi:ketosteroid isomerase-like protein